MAKVTQQQLIDLLSKLTSQAVELVENETDSEFNEDGFLQSIDKSRSPIIKQLLQKDIHGEAMRKTNDAYRKSVSAKFGVPLADLAGLESDEILEKGLQHYRENTQDSGKQQQTKIDEMLAAHKNEVARINSEWEQKHNEVTGQLTKKSMLDVLARYHKDAKGLPVDMNRDKAAEMFLTQLEKIGIAKLNVDGNDIEIYDRNDPSTRVLNQAKTATLGVSDLLKSHYSDLGLWKENTSDVNAATAASRAAKLTTAPTTPQPNGKTPHSQMADFKAQFAEA